MFKIYYTITVSLLLSMTLSAQTTFKLSQNFHPGEPNAAYKVVEHEGLYYLGGNYFDDEIGRWTAFYSVYDNEGSHVKLMTEKKDTVPYNDIGLKILKDSLGLYFLGLYKGNTNLYHYNLLADSSWLSHKIDQLPLDFSPHGVTLLNNKFFFCGRNLLPSEGNNVALVSVRDTVLKVFHDAPNFSYNERSSSIEANSLGELVVVAKRSFPSSSRGTVCFIMFFDEELNLLHTTKNTNDEVAFNPISGFCIDSQDNIILSGTGKSGDTIFQLIAKLDPKGKQVWQKKLDRNINNRYLEGRWHSIVEAHEKDGYIAVGGENYQDNNGGIDTLIVRAAVAKLSLDGELMWYRTYSYRNGPRRSEIFYDIQATSDGGYILVGDSATYDVPEEEELPWLQAIVLKTDAEGRLETSDIAELNVAREGAITLFPNPVEETLHLTQSIDRKLTLLFYDEEGKKVDSCVSYGAEHTIILDVSGYRAGSYSVIAVDNKGERFQSRFVKI